MIGKKIINQEPISLANVKELIEQKKKEGELTYEQNLTLEYCKKFSKLSKRDANALIEELSKIEKVSRKYAIVLADLLPKTPDEIRLIFSKEHFILSEDEIKTILSVLDKYR